MSDETNTKPLSGTAGLRYEQVTEQHDPDPHDKTVSMTTLPGMVNVYVTFGEGEMLLTQFPASKVIAANAAAKGSKSTKS